MKIPALADLELVELRNASPLRVQLLPNGTLFALRHETTLLNQLLPDPAEDGLFRLLLRRHDATGGIAGAYPLTGPGLGFAHTEAAASWTAPAGIGLHCTTVLQLHPQQTAWLWRVRVQNTGAQPRRVDVLHAQDLGLADEGAVRNNEAYTSQYIDLLPQRDEALGWTILARQNQAAAGGHYPWLAVACASGAEACCTDGWQFFGPDHRLTGSPAAVHHPALPSRRLQYEFALGGLQSRVAEVAPGATAEFVFLARFVAHHPAASSASDLALLHELLPAEWGSPVFPAAPAPGTLSLFSSAPWLHGERPSATELAAWFPGEPRHLEKTADGTVLSYFCGPDTHVVTRDKEALVARPHGHVLRSGDSSWIDEGQFGVTCYAAGLFGVQAYLGNPSFGRLLPVLRNALNLARSSGQRVFIRTADGAWAQLGLPSAFAMTPGEVRWIYRLGTGTIEARVWCSPARSASFLELRTTAGPPCEFLISHQLVLGTMEYEHTGSVAVHDLGWFACLPSSESLVGKQQPGTAFAIAPAVADEVAVLGGTELLYPDAQPRTGTQAVLRTKPVTRCGVIMLGVYGGVAALPSAVEAARAEYAAGGRPARPLAPRLRLSGAASAEIARIDEVIPWLNHNASIHYSAPHGLEQYGGAAWGVRDVCQGSVEWLLTAGRPDLVRSILTTVFSQQYARDGSWPQWFMHEPYRFIQQAHSHGDVCFWPVKALCDYVEASNDFAFLSAKVGYTDPEQFVPGGPAETLWEHCDRVVAHCESRFMAGTALVNYGDGDWDDTLQPADPTMRTRLTSAWTVGLAYHTFRQLAELSLRAGQPARAERLRGILARMRTDFAARLMPEGTVAGFLLAEKDGSARPLLHPTDKVTGIRYRLLPMTRSILAELFTPGEARHHLEIIERELRFPDGVRLMSEPAAYHGGLEKLFKRADTAANVGREIGLQYVHAHLRYAEALAKVGDADRLWTALQVVNPVALSEVVPNAAPRQSNVYFSSSDADFADRYEAARRWPELHRGEVPVRGGWRLYSSGPGLFLHKIRSCLLGLRESFDDVIFDPVLPRRLDGLVADTTVCGRPVTLSFRVLQSSHSPAFLTVNGQRVAGQPEANPYRQGGLRVAVSQLTPLLTTTGPNRIEIEL
ncbi:MAG: GH36-type glycosyl hydrolase domain-containing protein [Opitutales bacterium]